MKKQLTRLVMLTAISLFAASISFAQSGIDGEKFRTRQIRGSTYDLLNSISTKTGLMFIYDSKLIDNKRRSKLDAGEYTIEEAVKSITGNSQLKIKRDGNHILVFKEMAPEKRPEDILYNGERFIQIEGRVTDRHSGEPIMFVTVNPEGCSIGTITNQEGQFRLTIPDSLSERAISFSSMGYEKRKISASLLTQGGATIEMMQSVIPLQEVIIKVIDPATVLSEALRRRGANYSPSPINITGFFREGTEFKGNLSLSEAVIKIYKTGFSPTLTTDQVKLLKMRKITNMDGRDTIVAKLRSSLNAVLLLDIMKHPPDFLERGGMNYYNFTHTGVTEIDERRVYIFSFVQRDEIVEALFKGDLYIDAENSALVKAVFEVNPNHIRKFSDNLIVKRSKTHEVIPVKASYEVSYKQFRGYYHISHVRGDLNFKIRKKGRLFTSPLHLWFEMANCRTDTENVERFLSDERLSTRDIFSDVQFTYDPNFWEHFNIIIPEKKIEEIIREYNFR